MTTAAAVSSQVVSRVSIFTLFSRCPGEFLRKIVQGLLQLAVFKRRGQIVLGLLGLWRSSDLGKRGRLAWPMRDDQIPISSVLLAARPASVTNLPVGLGIGDVARWLEDVPNTFLAIADTTPTVVEGSCAG